MGDQKEKKPVISPSPRSTAAARINVKVWSQDNSELHFTIKKSTKLQKLMDAYCERKHVDVKAYRFLLDDQRIRESQTAEEDGSDVYFKIKRDAELQLLMTAYCNNKELSIKDVRFIHDGRFLKGWQTVGDVGLKDGDKIDVMASMDGGGCSNV